jgi:hypothetical protein
MDEQIEALSARITAWLEASCPDQGPDQDVEQTLNDIYNEDTPG